MTPVDSSLYLFWFKLSWVYPAMIFSVFVRPHFCVILKKKKKKDIGKTYVMIEINTVGFLKRCLVWLPSKDVQRLSRPLVGAVPHEQYSDDAAVPTAAARGHSAPLAAAWRCWASAPGFLETTWSLENLARGGGGGGGVRCRHVTDKHNGRAWVRNLGTPRVGVTFVVVSWGLLLIGWWMMTYTHTNVY